MKRFRLLYLLAFSTLFMLMACQSDDSTEQGGGLQSDGTVRVHLKVGVAGSKTTRAWTDKEADTKEMMNVWTVVAVNSTDNKVAAIFACKPTGSPDREVDDLVHLPDAGSYRFYSFANMAPKVVMALLGISGDGTPSTRADAGKSYPTSQPGNTNDGEGTNTALSDDELPQNGSNPTTGDPVSDPFMSNGNTYLSDTYYDIAFDEGSTVTADDANAVTVNVAGNNFNVDAADNLFGATGIPMSNVQTITVSERQNIDLIVIRLIAKIELQVYNDKGSEAVIESIGLTDLTKNSTDNLFLLPSLTDGADIMDYVHGDIQPNVNRDGGYEAGNMTLYPDAADGTIAATGHKSTDATRNPVRFTFYVNESPTPDNGFGMFFLKIKLTGEAEERYALIDNTNAEGKTGSWNYIARNDYRVIPIVLDDYKFDIIPYDFPAIGVYPASVKEEDGLYTINFHDYGHFHLLPVVKKMSDNSIVPFTATTPTGTYVSTSWGFIGDGFGDSWKSWTDATKETEYDNSTASPAFYRTGTDSYITTTTDGDEVGGEPVWYANTSSPQWDPAGGTNYRPFIFGYIADPGSALAEDRTVYHEFTINLYKQGMSAPRQMTYRLLMILDTDQMMYGSRRLGNAPSRHTHGF